MDNNELLEQNGQDEIMSTGYVALDAALGGGLRPGSITLIVGRPGMGRTSFLNKIEDNAPIGQIIVFDNVNLLPEKVPIEDIKKLVKRSQMPALISVKIPRSAESREDKRPRLSDLPAELVDAVNNIIGLYRDHYYHAMERTNEVIHEGEVLILKSDSGDHCTIPMVFDARNYRWSDVPDKKA